MPSIQPAYTGNEKYIFISYSHKDTDRVYPIIAKMQAEGYRVWYDDGIRPSENFSDDIALHVMGCSCFTAFVSQNYIDSEYCMNELEYAFSKKRKRLLVFLEDVELTPGAELQNSGIQHIKKFLIESDEEFYSILFKAPAFAPCKENVSSQKPKASTAFSSAKAQMQDSSIQTIEYAGGTYTGELIGERIGGVPHGKGKLTWANGNVYEGDWVVGLCTGKGKFTWANGDVYEGDFVVDKRTGKGKFTWAKGDVYEGDFVDGWRTGKGKYIWADGTVYEGDFVEGKLHGYGKKTYPDSRVKEGRWENNEFVG